MFKSARLKLTAWYLVIIMVISLAFSFFIYQLISVEIVRFARAQRIRIEHPFDSNFFIPPVIDIDLITETQNRLKLSLLVINGAIFAISGTLGYFLAGRTLSPIQKMVEEQNRFISDSSHELRTPLTSLKSAMEVSLRDKKLSLKDARELISESITEVDKLQSLSDELLMLTQYQKPNGRNNITEVSLDEIALDSIQKIRGLALLKNISIINSIKDITFRANRYSLTDLLVILLDNAIKYSPDHKKIFLTAQKNKNIVSFSVKDQGIGIDAKDIPFIFDRFYRADSSRTKTDVGGYGLGLSIAKKIVDNYQGKIAVKSILGKGSTFTVSFQV
jgi:two-component system, OmpR family, sensor histidine kinase CiaH